ncbi:acetate/propionate family kinase [Actibacterium sp. MT2.3-13A]|uniref:acetate/propionate family kinase n=1 Tax=Actibacterium sp. MT2.3-13A TaxID=2828332 RepID=UPI002011D48D|nr:acetate/propionate family kinase [Actibacterium sp. MT2.3-13A]
MGARQMSGAAILTINAGSSSVKFSVYEAGEEPVELGRGEVENLNAEAHLRVAPAGGVPGDEPIGRADHAGALRAILDHLAPMLDGRRVAGVGHRIVHGGAHHAAPQLLDDTSIGELHALEPLAPLHQPYNLAAVNAARAAFPDALQVGCFDTGFHRGHAWVNETFGLPRAYYDRGVRRYGFHGLSYEFIAGEIVRRHPELAGARVIVAHLGNGASMCAMHAGRSVNTTMGFSALDGLPMGTRTGQIDPGVLLYLMEFEKMDAAALTRLLYKESGLKGLSGISNDMRTLEASDAPEAAQAIDYFTARIRHEIGALTADLGGLDALVFTGGIGEHSALVRERVCGGMGWLGLSVDAGANAENAPEIGTGRMRVLVIPTDEERVIARAVARFLPGG